MDHALRVQMLCDDRAAWLPRVEQGLRAHGLLCAQGGSSVPRAAGSEARPVTLLLFDRLDGEVLAAVAELSRGGRDRALAVAMRREVLADGGAWRLMRHGASDAVAWDDLPDPMAHVAARLARWRQIDELIETPVVRNQLIGSSPAWIACLRQVVELALFAEGPVLLLGESGTGKELLARLLHALDPRAEKGDLVVLDCTTVVPELSGSEFFGHERGAFTGAVAGREGAFAQADGGTLFLDEVGELPLPLQAQLLRVVQERTYKRVGSNTWQRTSFRLICATHRDLRQDVAAGRFRTDFFHRIASRICHLPPLRRRRADILPLAEQFLRAGRSGRGGKEAANFDRAVARFLIERDYPGNVRELRQLVERIADRHVGLGPITPGDVPEDEWAPLAAPAPPEPAEEAGQDAPSSPALAERASTPNDRPPVAFDEAVVQALQTGCSLRDIGRHATEAAIRLALESEGGNLQRAAKRLGVTDRALQMRRAQRAE